LRYNKKEKKMNTVKLCRKYPQRLSVPVKILAFLFVIVLVLSIQSCSVEEDSLEGVRPIIYDFTNGQDPKNQDLTEEPSIVRFWLIGEYFGGGPDLHRGSVVFINVDTSEEYTAEIISWTNRAIFAEILLPYGKYLVRVRAREMESVNTIYFYKGAEHVIIDLD
jgi:hypothetical protein